MKLFQPGYSTTCKILSFLATYLFILPSMVRGEEGVMTCSSGICLPGDYNKMNLPGKKPLRVDAQMYLMEVYEVEKYLPPVNFTQKYNFHLRWTNGPGPCM